MPTTILVVDDDPFTRSLLSTLLGTGSAPNGTEVVFKSNCEEGLAAFLELLPLVVVVDVSKNGEDGAALCSAIRHNPRGGATHLMVLSSGFGERSIIERCETEFGAHFFAKPHQLRDLAEQVRQLAASSPRRAPSESGLQTLVAKDASGQTSHIIAAPSAGLINERPVAAVLLDRYDERASGRLVIRRGRITKTVELLDGNPRAISSNLREETLGHFLVQTGAISEEQQRVAVKRAAQQGMRVGEALLESGAITAAILVAKLTEQTRHKLASMLRWRDGEWRFTPSPIAARGETAAEIDMVDAVLDGLRATATATSAAAVSSLPTGAVTTTDRLDYLQPILRKRFGNALVDAVLSQGQGAAKKGASRANAGLFADCLVQCGVLVTAHTPHELDDIPMLSTEDLSEVSALRRLPDARVGELQPDSPANQGTADDAYEDLVIDAPIPVETSDASSGFIDISDIDLEPFEAGEEADEAAAAKRKLLTEHLRVQEVDHYTILHVARDASPAAIAASATERKSRFSRDWFDRFDLAGDDAKLDEIHGAYDRALRVLMDDDARSEYDRRLSGADADSTAPSLDAEISYQMGEALLARGEFVAAMASFREAISLAAEEAEYHAALGWATYLSGGRTASAADDARPHLNRALAMHPDHAGAHEWIGLISAALGTDDTEAIFHLEKALEASPYRSEALTTLETLWARQGAYRPLERLYRKLIYRVAGRDPVVEAALWVKLGFLYRNELGESKGARLAFESASRLTPDDQIVRDALAELGGRSDDRFYERTEMLRAHWRRDPNSAGPGLELLRAAQQASRLDVAFLASSALVARGLADAEAEAAYLRYRPRFVIRAHRPITGAPWDLLRHTDDLPALTEIFDIISGLVHDEMPLELADVGVTESDRIVDLPEALLRMCEYASQLLEVPRLPVYRHREFGREIHVGALRSPVLLVGDDVLNAPERSELSFRVGRAMSFARAGRALAGSRPARLLRSALLGAFHASGARASGAGPDGTITRLGAGFAALPPGQREACRQRIDSLARETHDLDLSRWGAAVARTADRVGLLMCGDLPAALRFSNGTPDTVRDLVDYAVSARFFQLRRDVGLSIDV